MRRLATIILATLAVALPVAPAVIAADPAPIEAAAACANPARFTLHENDGAIGDTTGPWCASISNLANVPHVPAGGCAKAVGESSTWNDCVSAITVWSLGANRCISVHTDSNYGGVTIRTFKGPLGATPARYSLGGFWNDTASSVRYNYAC